MNNTLTKIALLALAPFLLAACSGYNSLLKSNDPNLMFNKAMEYYQARKYSRTIQLLETVAPYYNGSVRADSVAYFLGAANYNSGDFHTSAILLNEFRQTYGQSKFLEDAEYMYAKGYYYLSMPANRDQLATKQALFAIDEYMARYPQSPKKEMMEGHIVELMQKLHDKEFLNAKSYYKTGRHKAAAVALKSALNKYPDTSHREEILYMTAKSRYLLAANSISERQRDRYLDMMDSYYDFISEYPDSKHVKELTKMQEVAKEYTAKFKDLENYTETKDGE